MEPLVAVFMITLIVTLPVCFASTLSLTNDANGNLVTGDGKYRVYNSLNQLYRIYNGTNTSGNLLEEYVYHPIEERVLIKRTYTGTSTLKETVYYINENFVRVVNSSGTYNYTYVYHEGSLVAQVNSDGSKQFIHGDHLGSSTVVTNEAGVVIENTSYAPYGEVLTGGESTRFDYEGKEYDSTTGSYDFHFRGYNPSWGIFTQPDTVISNHYNPQTLNRYSFEHNNPYNKVDEDGHVAHYIVAAAIGFVGGSFGYMLTHSGSGWSHVGKTYAAGVIGAGAAMGTVAFATSAGAAAAGKGIMGALGMAGKFLIGASSDVAYQSLDDKDINMFDAGMAGLINIPSFGYTLKPGSYMGVKNLFTKNNIKMAKQLIGGSVSSTIYSMFKNLISSQVNQQNSVISTPTTDPASEGNEGSDSISYYGISGGGIEARVGSRKIGVGSDKVTYNIPLGATYHPGFWK